MGDSADHPFAAKIDELAEEIKDDVIAWRRDFHQHPFASKARAMYEGREVGVMRACGHDVDSLNIGRQ